VLLQVLSPAAAFSDKLTGRAATAVSIMGMSGNAVTLCELKPGVDAKTLFDGLDAAKINEALKKVGIPITYELQKAVAKHGETELHRFGLSSENPMVAMSLATMQGCMAARGNLLYVAMSPTGEDDLKVLLDKVQRDEKVTDNPHAQAMARLGRGYNIGFTFNVGALKQPIRMFAMFGVPNEVVQAVQAIPDVLTLSTAITFPDGNIRWRGDWPVKDVAKAAEAIMKSMPQAKKPEKGEDDEGGDEEFD
jgi:hypothetical protein